MDCDRPVPPSILTVPTSGLVIDPCLLRTENSVWNSTSRNCVAIYTADPSQSLRADARQPRQATLTPIKVLEPEGIPCVDGIGTCTLQNEVRTGQERHYMNIAQRSCNSRPNHHELVPLPSPSPQ